MRSDLICVLFAAIAVCGGPASAQTAYPPLIPGPADSMPSIAVYPAATAPPTAGEDWGTIGGQRVVRNVTTPTLTPFLPDPAKANGAAVIVAPGGAFAILSFDNEGTAVGRWLADRGVAAFVLKYRLDPTPHDVAGFTAAMGARMGAAMKRMSQSGAPLEFPGESLAQADGSAALRLVRARAADWKIDPKRVGFVGFSAGGMTAANVATAPDPLDRPDFVGVIYGASRSPPPADAPPAFFVVAADDPLLGDATVPMFTAWKAAHRPAELHVYERGGHGFGMMHNGFTSDHWIDEFFGWMDMRGLFKPTK